MPPNRQLGGFFLEKLALLGGRACFNIVLSTRSVPWALSELSFEGNDKKRSSTFFEKKCAPLQLLWRPM